MDESVVGKLQTYPDYFENGIPVGGGTRGGRWGGGGGGDSGDTSLHKVLCRDSVLLCSLSELFSTVPVRSCVFFL